MEEYTENELQAAAEAMVSMIGRSEKAWKKFAVGTAQHTLQKNRIHALKVGLALVKKEFAEPAGEDLAYTKEELKAACAPIASLTQKSQKARLKLAADSWQHRMLSDNLCALAIVTELLENALAEA